jgi:hypothetical protein
MNSFPVVDLSRVLCAGYVLAVACLNVTMYLISAFYKRKFNEPTPQAGFVVSIAFSLCYAASVFVQVGDGRVFVIAQYCLLVLSAVSSAWSSIVLFFTMKKERK